MTSLFGVLYGRITADNLVRKNNTGKIIANTMYGITPTKLPCVKINVDSSWKDVYAYANVDGVWKVITNWGLSLGQTWYNCTPQSVTLYGTLIGSDDITNIFSGYDTITSINEGFAVKYTAPESGYINRVNMLVNILDNSANLLACVFSYVDSTLTLIGHSYLDDFVINNGLTPCVYPLYLNEAQIEVTAGVDYVIVVGTSNYTNLSIPSAESTGDVAYYRIPITVNENDTISVTSLTTAYNGYRYAIWADYDDGSHGLVGYPSITFGSATTDWDSAGAVNQCFGTLFIATYDGPINRVMVYMKNLDASYHYNVAVYSFDTLTFTETKLVDGVSQTGIVMDAESPRWVTFELSSTVNIQAGMAYDIIVGSPDDSSYGCLSINTGMLGISYYQNTCTFDASNNMTYVGFDEGTAGWVYCMFAYYDSGAV